METNKILTADILDLIFEGRYKEYGAYELRKTYNKRIKAGLIGMIAVVAVLGAMAIISNSIKKPKTEIVAVDMSLENVAQDEKKAPPPPPPPEGPGPGPGPWGRGGGAGFRGAPSSRGPGGLPKARGSAPAPGGSPPFPPWASWREASPGSPCSR